MRRRFSGPGWLRAALAGVACLSLAVPAFSQAPACSMPQLPACPTPQPPWAPSPVYPRPEAQPPAPGQPEPRPAEGTPPAAEPTPAPETGAAVGGEGVAAATTNMIGDLLMSPSMRCVTIPHLVFRTQSITPPPVLVTPQPFVFTPVVTAQPPSVTVTPPPLHLPNGQVINLPPFQATPPAITTTLSPITLTPPPFLATPPAVVLPGLVPTIIFEQRCFEVLAAASRASSFKIAEDESVMPQDRVYFNFNYFDDVNKAVNLRLNGDSLADVNEYRETLGFEKTFLHGQASVGLRVPLGTIELDSSLPGVSNSQTDIGDVSLILKLAPYLDRRTGDVLAGGLVITAPTGPHEFNPYDTVYLQPWGGYKWNFGNLFTQGFLSVAIPTDARDVTLLFNDASLGYYLYRNPDRESWLSAVIPTAELHLTTPLDHRGAFHFADPVATPDLLTLTLGSTFELAQKATLAVAAGIPLTGPRPYDYEMLVQFNWHF